MDIIGESDCCEQKEKTLLIPQQYSDAEKLRQIIIQLQDEYRDFQRAADLSVGG